MLTTGQMKTTQVCNHVFCNPIPYEGEGVRFYVKRGTVRIYSADGTVEGEGFVAVVSDEHENIVGRLEGIGGQRQWLSKFKASELDALKLTGYGIEFNHL